MTRKILIEDDASQYGSIQERLRRLEQGIPEDVHVVGAVGEPAFQNSWVNFNTATYVPAGFYRYGGRVYLNGIIKSGTLVTVAFTLPADYWPLSDEILPVWSNSAFGGLVVQADGGVRPNSGSNASFSLDGVSFRHA